MIRTTAIGRVGATPEPLGTNGAMKFRLGCSGWDSQAKARKTNWLPCIAFGKTADTVRQYIDTGKQIAVAGKLDITEREVNGQKRTFFQLLVDELELLADGKASNGNPPAGMVPASGNEFGW